MLDDEAVVDIMQILLIIKVSMNTNTADSDCTVVFFIFYVISSNLSLKFFYITRITLDFGADFVITSAKVKQCV